MPRGKAADLTPNVTAERARQALTRDSGVSTHRERIGRWDVRVIELRWEPGLGPSGLPCDLAPDDYWRAITFGVSLGDGPHQRRAVSLERRDRTGWIVGTREGRAGYDSGWSVEPVPGQTTALLRVRAWFERPPLPPWTLEHQREAGRLITWLRQEGVSVPDDAVERYLRSRYTYESVDYPSDAPYTPYPHEVY